MNLNKRFGAPKAATQTVQSHTLMAASDVTLDVLPSGLTVACRTMPGFGTVHALYGTAFGSTTRHFSLDGKEVTLPAGTAHFLEHKMFESERGDAFERYAKTGASANAYTGYDRTCYLFSATNRVEENLDILLSMIGEPYFTAETIQKEQGIIGQEIKMYDDNPDWRLLSGLFRCLYPTHPIRDDIAGTVESIAELTPELLYACTDAFYRPGNMILSVAGNVRREQVLEACARAGLDHAAPPRQVVVPSQAESGPIAQRSMNFSMPVSKPCFGLGYREEPIRRGDVRREVLIDMLPELICGGMTTLYRKLYDEALVNPEFDGDYAAANDCCCIAFTGESTQPELVAQLVREEIGRLRRDGVEPELFTLVKNQMYGGLVAGLESVEAAAGASVAAWLKGCTLPQEIDALAQLRVEDADELLQNTLQEENSAFVVITPEQ